MANKFRYTAQQVADVLTETKGMMFIAAQRLGCSQETVRQYCKRFALVQAAKDAQRGIMVDTAELKLWQSIQNGESWGITLCLKTIGKDRGYVERQELTGEDGTGMVLRVVYENAPEILAPTTNGIVKA
jgi:hypothetical protein